MLLPFHKRNFINKTGPMPYSVFANRCPLQTDTILFSIIQSHHIQLSQTKSCYETYD